MKIAITIPLYISNWNHRDFVNGTTRSIQTSHEWVFLPVLNYVADQFRPYAWQLTQQPAEIVALEGRQPQAVSKAWNDGIAKAIELGCEYILVLNDDIVLKSNAIDNLIAHAEAHPEAILWSMGGYHDLFTLEQAVDNPNDVHEHPNFSAFMVHKSFPQTFGLFDENFTPGYFEDSDAHARIALAGQRALVTGGAWFFHFGSRTINSDPEFRETMPPLFNRNQAYFIEKWGHPNVGEVEHMRELYFKHPYNEEDKPLSSWRGHVPVHQVQATLR
jgi:hypothetical protein